MDIVTHLVLGYILFVPIYLILGATSIKQYIFDGYISKKAIEVFLFRLRFPLKIFYADKSGLNLFSNEYDVDLSDYLKAASASSSLHMKFMWGSVGLLTVVAITIGLTRQIEASWIIEHVILIAIHSYTLYKAWRLGSNLSIIEASLSETDLSSRKLY